MTKLILLNGPPRSGKDFAGRVLAESAFVHVDKFARVVKERTHAAYGLMDECASLPHWRFEERKDVVLPEFLGVTPRQAYIAFSEKFLKPLHGPGIFGELLLEDLRFVVAAGLTNEIVITDSGFRAEAEVLIEWLGPESVTLVRLHRSGCSFAHDSRSHLDLEDLGVRGVDLMNEGDERFADKLRRLQMEIDP